MINFINAPDDWMRKNGMPYRLGKDGPELFVPNPEGRMILPPPYIPIAGGWFTRLVGRFYRWLLKRAK